MEDKIIVVTHHAVKRIRERVGVTKKASDALALRALDEGLSHTELKGNLRKFVDGLFLRSKSANNMRVLHDKVYLFKNNLLITVISLPHNLAKIALKLKRRKNSEEVCE